MILSLANRLSKLDRASLPRISARLLAEATIRRIIPLIRTSRTAGRSLASAQPDAVLITKRIRRYRGVITTKVQRCRHNGKAMIEVKKDFEVGVEEPMSKRRTSRALYQNTDRLTGKALLS
jgi:hypothetical protein